MSSREINPESSSGSNSKDAMFEPKPKPKMIRVLTVLAYVLSVSMAAILLSIYYIFMWDGRPHLGARSHEVEAIQNYSDRHVVSIPSKYIAPEDFYNTSKEEFLNMTQGDEPSEATLRIVKRIAENYGDGLNATVREDEDTTDYRKQQSRETANLPFEFSVALKLKVLEKAFLLLKRKMSYKSTNGIKMTKCDSQQWKTNSIHEASVKLAGEEAKDRLYEPKHKKKLVRVLTVVAYVFFVSLAAIMLSLYYVFLWNGDQKIATKYVTTQPRQQRQYISNKCNSILAELQQQITAIASEELPVSSTVPTTSEESTVTWPDDYDDLEKPNIFIKKMLNYDY